MTTETVVIENTSGVEDWFLIGDASHDVINFEAGIIPVNLLRSDFKVRVQNVKPDAAELLGLDPGINRDSASSGWAVAYNDVVRIENANENVWLRLKDNAKVVVLRGSARILGV